MPLTVRANLATQWQGFNGNVTAPMYSFSSAPGSGMFHAGNQQIGLSVNGTEVAQVTTQGLVVKAGSNVAPSITFSGNTSAGLYLANNLVTSSTNLQTPFGIATVMNTSTVITGSMPAFIHPIGCSVHSASAPGVSTGIVTPIIANFAVGSVLAFYKNSAAPYDFWRTYINLAAGTYTFRLHACKEPTQGIVTVVVGSTNIGTVDLYAGALVDAISDITSIVIPSTGTYKIELQINTKNASSGSYNLSWRAAAFIRTA